MAEVKRASKLEVGDVIYVPNDGGESFSYVPYGEIKFIAVEGGIYRIIMTSGYHGEMYRTQLVQKLLYPSDNIVLFKGEES